MLNFLYDNELKTSRRIFILSLDALLFFGKREGADSKKQPGEEFLHGIYYMLSTLLNGLHMLTLLIQTPIV